MAIATRYAELGQKDKALEILAEALELIDNYGATDAQWSDFLV